MKNNSIAFGAPGIEPRWMSSAKEGIGVKRNAQRAAYHGVAGDLKLAYAQFEELEAFARVDTRLDENTQNTRKIIEKLTQF